VLSPDIARTQLGELKSKRHRAARLARLQKLPKPAAAAGFGLLELLPTGKPPKEWADRTKLGLAAAATLTADAKLRAKVFAALFPTLAADIEAGWQLRARLPYTTGYNRRAFRAPNRPELLVTARQLDFEQLFKTLGEYPDDVLSAKWVAEWAVHLGHYTAHFGPLLAAAIDAFGPDGDAVLEIVQDSAAGRHPVGGPGWHATRALLCSSRPEAWQFAENLLLAAQRQEGLRQSILEAVDEAHPEAFRRMLSLILDENLLRFAAVARAAGVWLGAEQFVENPKKLKADLTACRDLMTDPAARRQAIDKGDATTAYAGLWATAFEDAAAAVKLAAPLFKDRDPARRFAAAKLVAEAGLKEGAALMLPLLNDPDPRLVSAALQYCRVLTDDDEAGRPVAPKDLFERVAAVFDSLPEGFKALKPLVPEWPVADLGRKTAAHVLLIALGKRPAERLLPYLPSMTDYDRVQALAKVCEPRTLSSKVRQVLLAAAGEPAQYVREAALKYLVKCKLAEDEAQTLEGYLSRTRPDFRRAVFGLLLNRSDKLAVATIDRLLAAGDANRRAAGVEMARRMIDDERMAEPVRERLRDFRDRRGKRLTAPEADAVEAALNPASRPPTLADGLGLFDPADRSPAVPPKKRKVKFITPAATAFVTALDALIHEHRSDTFTLTRSHGRVEEKVLGSLSYRWEFPEPDAKLAADEDRTNLPLLDLWEAWWNNRPAKTRDADGFELLRVRRMPRVQVREGETVDEDDEDDDEPTEKVSPLVATLREAAEPLTSTPVGVRYSGLIERLLEWFEKLHPPAGAADFLLDAAETALALVPDSAVEQTPPAPIGDEDDDDKTTPEDKPVEWRTGYGFDRWLDAAGKRRGDSGWTPKHDARLWRLSRWLDEPVPGSARLRPGLPVLLAGYEADVATPADFVDHLVGPREVTRWGSSFQSLGSVTATNAAEQFPTLARRPELRAAVDAVVARVIECELVRGETPTEATPAANAISTLYGMETLLTLLAALGKHGFAPGSVYSPSLNKPAVLTHLVRCVVPDAAATPEAFAAAAAEAVAGARFPASRVVELGLINTRWLRHAAAATGWAGFEEAVYWFIAHIGTGLRPDMGGTAEESKDAWNAVVKSRTNLTAEQLADGLIDVAWFHAAYKAVGNDTHWDAIEAAAKYLGYGQAYKKAARLADVLLGRTKKKELVEAIKTKFLKESVRLLGLLPLPEDAAKRQAELADRYQALRGYERYARGLSSLSKEPALQAARLGMENLAVTAGFADPVRLEWSVTADEVADLAAGPVTVSAGPVTVELTLTAAGEAEVSQAKDGKPLAKLPADARKVPAVLELLDRKKSVTRTVSNSKRSLEQAMCAGSRFRGSELVTLMAHPLVRPLVERLVLKTDAGLGYPAAGGKSLTSPGGKSRVGVTDEWCVAHPLDFVAAGDWPAWQAECFKAERVQPFKQVFREVYVPTAAEREDGDRSRRYSGQQVNESQAKALLAGRGWSTREGLDKTFRDAGIIVELTLDDGYSTPADAAAPAVGDTRFRRRGDWKPVPLVDVPAKLFSEVMRDLDLVVSVAHVGGVDPEATQSTTEMRAALVATTCGYLKLGNVALEGRHALVRGEYGRYSVHLGSGVVHKLPGGSLCIVPVNAQHRGRLFLPFADDDPRTAEVVSKVILLARDSEIQDPTILQQIVGK
jgi:hypothetical protein